MIISCSEKPKNSLSYYSSFCLSMFLRLFIFSLFQCVTQSWRVSKTPVCEKVSARSFLMMDITKSLFFLTKISGFLDDLKILSSLCFSSSSVMINWLFWSNYFMMLWPKVEPPSCNFSEGIVYYWKLMSIVYCSCCTQLFCLLYSLILFSITLQIIKCVSLRYLETDSICVRKKVVSLANFFSL